MIEKKSRFTGRIWPVETEEEALAHIKKTRDEFWDATHNVYAYIIKGGATRYSDDGEPGGTAGMPGAQCAAPGGDFQRLLRCHPLFWRDTAGCRRAGAGLGKGCELALDAAGISVQRVWAQVQYPVPVPSF